MSKPPEIALVTALGLMSGTSLDGIDVALVKTDGEARVERGPSRTYAYAEDPAPDCGGRSPPPYQSRTARTAAGYWARRRQRSPSWHADAVRAFLRGHKNGGLEKIGLIGFHGQTVIHRPERRLTVQLGDGEALATAFGPCPVAFDLRAADVAAGGQGAPLVPAYHGALAAALPERPVAFREYWRGGKRHLGRRG